MLFLSILTTAYVLLMLTILVWCGTYNYKSGTMTPGYWKVVGFIGLPSILAIINIWILFANLG